MNIRTNIKGQLLLPFYVATSNIILGPTQARKGLNGFAPPQTIESVPTYAQTEAPCPVTPTKKSAENEVMHPTFG